MIAKLAWKNIWFKPLNTILSVVLLTSSVAIITTLVLVEKQFEEKSGGIPLSSVVKDLLNAYNPDTVEAIEQKIAFLLSQFVLKFDAEQETENDFIHYYIGS